MPSITTSFDVTGMTCGNCEKHVRRAAERVPGVSAVDVDRSAGRARVVFDPTTATAADIAAAITEAGYPAASAPTTAER
jgi:mercuric ion binding protein